MNVYFRLGENYEINEADKVKVIHFENTDSYEITHIKGKQDNLSKYKKISKDEHIDIITGEIIKDKQNTERDIGNIKRTLKR
jgi:hypothetical protein